MKKSDFNIIRNENGVWVVSPKVAPSYEEFKDILAIMKSHGGLYSKGAKFLFKDEPSWINTEEELTPTKTKEVEQLVQAATKDFKEERGIEFEIHKPATIDECEKYAKAALDPIDEDDCKDHHEILLNMLVEACKTDDELRASFTHKEYMKTFETAGRAAFNKLQKVSISPKALFPFMVEEYKKIETKPVPKTDKKETKKTTTRKKTTKK